MELAMANGFGGVRFTEMNEKDMMWVDGGANWDRVFTGSVTYLSATLAVATVTGPIGWIAGAAYVGICAASSGYIAYGLLTD